MTKLIPYPEHPFPHGWERSSAAEECYHQWETVRVQTMPPNPNVPDRIETVIRCEICHTPRCDRLDQDRTQCVERRHHSTVHIYPSGRFDPIGGYLRAEA